MILDPVNAITSVNFYKKIAGQSGGRTALYLVYVSLIFAVASTIALKVRLGPDIDETFTWLGQSVPTLTFQAGKLSSTTSGPVTVRHPKISEIAVTIDTARTDAVTPEMLEQQKLVGYVTGNTVYARGAGGKVDVYDLSKIATQNPVTIDASFYQNARRLISRVLYPCALIFGFFFTFFWKSAAAAIYSLFALMINAFMEGGQPYSSLFNISAYAMTLVIALQAIFLFMPVGLPAFSLLALIATGAYIWLAIKRLKDAPPPAAAA